MMLSYWGMDLVWPLEWQERCEVAQVLSPNAYRYQHEYTSARHSLRSNSAFAEVESKRLRKNIYLLRPQAGRQPCQVPMAPGMAPRQRRAIGLLFLVVVASFLPQHLPFPLPLWDDPIVHRPFPPSSSPSCINIHLVAINYKVKVTDRVAHFPAHPSTFN
jgi:hypothetical protein